MRVRLISHPDVTGYASEFNTHGLGEVIVYYEDGSADSEYIRNLQVFLSNQTWVGLKEAFGLHLVIPDNHHRYFGEPRTEQERDRGWCD